MMRILSNGSLELLSQAEASKSENGEENGQTMVNATDRKKRAGLCKAFTETTGVHFKVGSDLFGWEKVTQTLETMPG